MTIRILTGDCRDVLKTLADASVDSIVTDPPYHLTTGKKGGSGPASVNLESPYGRARIGAGFMGMKWDGGDVAFQVAMWAECLRVLKPGGHLLAFSGTRTQHRMVCAIEDAGFEIRDQAGWMYGSGFPKSKNLHGEWSGWGTALKPAWEPICVARKPFVGTVAANVQAHGTGALNIDGCRVETDDDLNGGAYSTDRQESQSQWHHNGSTIHKATGEAYVQPLGRWPANLLHDGSPEVVALFPESAGQLIDSSSSSSSRPGQNVYGNMKRGNGREGEASAESDNDGGVGFKMKPGARRGDEGSAARFFWCPKTSSADRHDGLEHPGQQFSAGSTPRDAEKVNAERKGNHHPTVKPTELMRYLCRLVTPPGGTVLDPFTGSGSTLKAAELEGFSAIGIEMDPAYVEIARRRIASDAPLFAEVS